MFLHFLYKIDISDQQIADNVRRMYSNILNICAERAIRDGDAWRSNANPEGCANNAQLWILGKCLGHDSTLSIDEDLFRAIRQKMQV